MISRHKRLLEAALDAILPSDDGCGARSCNDIAYVEWLTGQPFFALNRPSYDLGLELLDSFARVRFRLRFEDCSMSERGQILSEIQGIPHRLAQSFVESLVCVALGGFLCDPRYGGNRDGLGWKFIGFDPAVHIQDVS